MILSFEHLNLSKSSGHVEADRGHEQGLLKAGSPFGIQHLSGTAVQVQNIVQSSLLYGVSNRLMLMAAVPYVFNQMTFVGETEKADGLGDPEVTAMLSLLPEVMGKINLQAVAGARLPLGQADLKNDHGDLLDSHVQAGAGAWAGNFGLQAMLANGGLPLYASTAYQINGANDQNFSYGDVWRYNVAAQKTLGRIVDVIGEINGRYAEQDQEGEVKDANSGGSVVYFSPGVRLRMFSAVSLRAQVQIPVLENLNGVQDEETNFRTALVWEM
ncbi:MAG: hypothetical protein ACREOO_01305 [bacterium]